jgi:hypothetical protein
VSNAAVTRMKRFVDDHAVITIFLGVAFCLGVFKLIEVILS